MGEVVAYRRLHIREWRNFEQIELQLDHEAALVCLVGANGTGKSHLLELIAACAHKLGLAPGISKGRGNPFVDPHDFELQFYLAEGVSEAVEGLANQAEFADWDRTLWVRGSRMSALPPEAEVPQHAREEGREFWCGSRGKYPLRFKAAFAPAPRGKVLI